VGIQEVDMVLCSGKNVPRKDGWPLRGIVLQRQPQSEINHPLLVRVMTVEDGPDDRMLCIVWHRLASQGATLEAAVELATDLQVACPDVHSIH
jgi:hypothetical protein